VMPTADEPHKLLAVTKIVGSTIVLLGFGVLAFLWGKSHKQKSS